MNRDEHLAELSATLSGLGDNEIRVVSWLARRLLVGQRRYGRVDLAGDRRDWRRERAEEIADLLVYSGFEELSRVLRDGGDPR
jgi:hypothetical protein